MQTPKSSFCPVVLICNLPLASLKGAVLKNDMKIIQTELRQNMRICFSMQKNPSGRPAYPYKVVRLQKRCAAVPARSSNTSPVCVKVSGAPNLLDTQSGGQVFHSDVINHSPHNTVLKTALSLSYTYFCLKAAEARFQRQRQDFSFPLTLICGSPYPTLIGWLT